jgi:Zn-dependent metalloprotease
MKRNISTLSIFLGVMAAAVWPFGCADMESGKSLSSSQSFTLSTTPSFSQARFEELDDLYRITADTTAWLPNTGMPTGALGKQSSRRGVLRAISGVGMAIPVAGLSAGASPEQAARAFLDQWGDLFGLVDQSVELVTLRVTRGLTPQMFVRFDQVTPSGLPVFGHGLIVTLNSDNTVADVSGLVLPDPPDGPAAVSSTQAVDIAMRALAVPGSIVKSPELGVYDPEFFEEPRGPARLAWKVDIHTNEPAILRHYVDAGTGTVLFANDALPHNELREVWWADHNLSKVGVEMMFRYYPYFQHDPWEGTSQAIYNGNTAAWHYYWDRYHRDGWDNNQAPVADHRLYTTSDFGSAGLHAAWWDPDLYLAFFGDEGACTDAVGHETTHGVDQFEAKLQENYVGQTGALAESFSDIFGEFVERYWSDSGPDWLVGSELVVPPDSCYPWRDIANCESPSCGSCPIQPAHFSNFNRWGTGVHDNCGIPNKSGWLLGREPELGQVTFAGITVTGIGEIDAGKVWYDALTNRLSSSSKFTQFRIAIVNSAINLFGWDDSRYTQSYSSVNATGIWSLDQNPGFDSQHRIDLATFTISGVDRRYVFYREPVDINPRLLYKYRTCPIYSVGQCSWTAATQLHYAGKGPGAVVFDGKLWVFYKYDLNNYIYYRTLDSSGTWSGASRPTGYPTTDSDVAAAVYNGKLYLFYKTVGSGATAINYYTWTPGEVGWEGPLPAGSAASEYGPAVTPYGNVLVLVYVKGATSPNLRYCTLSGGWSGQVTPADNLSLAWAGSPTAYIFKNRLHVAGRSSSNDIIYRSLCWASAGCTYRPNEWTWNVKLDSGARNFVTLFEDGVSTNPPALYLFLRDESANAIYWRLKCSE